MLKKGRHIVSFIYMNVSLSKRHDTHSNLAIFELGKELFNGCFVASIKNCVTVCVSSPTGSIPFLTS